MKEKTEMEDLEKQTDTQKPKADYNRPDGDRQTLAKGRNFAARKGLIPKFDKVMKEAGIKPLQGVEAQELHEKIVTGTVDKDVLLEASRRKMHAGGRRPLKEFIQDVLLEQSFDRQELKK